MKIFRWVLSHLTLIVVLSLILYVYWNRGEFWPEVVANQSQVQRAVSDTRTDDKTKANKPEVAANSPEQITDSPEQITNSPEQTIKNPEQTTMSSELTIVGKNQLESEKSFLKHDIIVNEENKLLHYPGDETDTANTVNALTEDSAQQSVDTVDTVDTESSEIGHSDSQNTETLQSNKQKLELESVQDKSLQEQIRTRQKKLRKQMISLIVVSKDKDGNDKQQAVQGSELKSDKTPH